MTDSDEPVTGIGGRASSRPLLGRDRELRFIRGLLDGVGDHGGALIVRGEAGIGKSTLLDAARSEASSRGFQVLTIRGAQSEADLPFAGLHQLLRPHLDRLDQLPDRQRTAILSAFGAAEQVVPELFVIALATLNLIADLAASSPVLLLIEQTDVIDPPSLDVLAFVGRRLEADPVILLAALRDGPKTALDDAGLPEMRLEGLDDDASLALLEATAPDLNARVRDRLLQEALGNPLALTELPAALGPDQVGDDSRLPDRLPLTARLERTFESRVSTLPEPTRRLLLLAAADDRGVLADLLAGAATANGDASADALEPAVDAHLIDIDATTVRFRHPLMRSAIYQAASDHDRRAAHAALAAALSGDLDRRVAHLAASVIGPDEGVAADLEAAAERARRRGAVVVAVATLERSANLTIDPGLRLKRRIRAAELAIELGRADLINRILEDVDPATLQPLDQARILWIREVIDQGDTGHDAQIRLLVATADQTITARDPELALNLLWAAEIRSWRADPGPDVRGTLVTTAERVPLAADDPRVLAILAAWGPHERAASLHERLLRKGPGEALDPDTQRFLGMAATTIGDFVLAESYLGSSIAPLRAQGRLAILAQSLVSHAWAASHTRGLHLAAEHAEEGGRLARETAQPLWSAGSNVTLSTIAAMRGDDDAADRFADEAERATTTSRSADVLADLQLSRGVAALGRDRHAEAYVHLRRIYDRSDVAFHPTTSHWAIGDLVEAAVRSGHAAEARGLMDEMETLAALTPSPRFQLAMMRARPWLAPEAETDALYQAALAGDLSGWPFGRGRLHMAYGEWLRRHRRVVDARDHLRIARDTFDVFGAIRWADRARRELRAAGEISRGRTVDAVERLTPQELHISRMAAQGLSNREIGEQLYLSPRTIGFHLYHVYPKLGVTSRAELTAVLSRQSLLTD